MKQCLASTSLETVISFSLFGVGLDPKPWKPSVLLIYALDNGSSLWRRGIAKLELFMPFISAFPTLCFCTKRNFACGKAVEGGITHHYACTFFGWATQTTCSTYLTQKEWFELHSHSKKSRVLWVWESQRSKSGKRTGDNIPPRSWENAMSMAKTSLIYIWQNETQFNHFYPAPTSLKLIYLARRIKF